MRHPPRPRGRHRLNVSAWIWTLLKDSTPVRQPLLRLLFPLLRPATLRGALARAGRFRAPAPLLVLAPAALPATRLGPLAPATLRPAAAFGFCAFTTPGDRSLALARPLAGRPVALPAARPVAGPASALSMPCDTFSIGAMPSIECKEPCQP